MVVLSMAVLTCCCIVSFIDSLELGTLSGILPFMLITRNAPPEIIGFTASSHGFLEFFGTLVCGALADTYGRRFMVLTSLTFTFFGMVSFAFGPGSVSALVFSRGVSTLFPSNVSLEVFLSSLVIMQNPSNLNFGNSASDHWATTYIAYAQAAASAGGMLAPYLGICLRKPIGGFQQLTAVVAVLSAFNLLQAWRFLPEPLTNRRSETLSSPLLNPQDGCIMDDINVGENEDGTHTGKHVTPWQVVMEVIPIIRKRWDIRRLYLLGLLQTCAHNVFVSTFLLYTADSIGMDADGVHHSKEYGLLLFANGLASLMLQVLLVRHFVCLFGELQCLLTTQVSMTLLEVAILVSPSSWAPACSFILIGACVALANPCFVVVLVERSPSQLCGTILGGYHTMNALAKFIGPVIAGGLYTYCAWAPFCFAACLSMLAAMLTWSVAGRGFRTQTINAQTIKV